MKKGSLATCYADWRPQLHKIWRMLVVIYVVHKRVTVDVGSLATLTSKSYKHFWTLLLANSSDIIVSKNQTQKEEEEVIFTPFYGLIYAFGTCTACNH